MKNKKLFGALSLLLATGLILSGCNNKKSESSTPAPSSSTQPSSSSSEAVKYTVTFVVNGTTVQTSEVEAGSVAQYTGETPTKAGDAQAYAYGFRGWDKDITQPITEDTTFTAVFAEYAEANVVDTFEGYADSGAMHDDGKWVPAKYNNTSTEWEDDQGGNIDLSTNATEGVKALRFQSWGNGVGYKACKKLTAGAYTQSANALKFTLKTARFNTVKVIVFTAPVTISGEEVVPSATYTLPAIQSNEVVEYTIPMDAEWAVWGDKAKYGTIATSADWTGIHQDDVVKMLTRLEFYVQGNDDAGGQQQFSFVDNVRFVTLNQPTEQQIEETGIYERYTGTTAQGYTVRLTLGENGAAAAQVLDAPAAQPEIPGTYEISGSNITFTSADSGATLIYRGQVQNKGQLVKFTSADGSIKDAVGTMDLNAVQVIDNFDDYTGSGTAWHKDNTETDRSGFRGDFYQEYYAGSGTSPWAGSGWSLMGGDPAGQQANLMTNGGHSGNNYASFKASKSVAMRYMQMGLFRNDKIPGDADKQSFRGSKFSFWAKSTNTTLKIRVTVFSTPNPILDNEQNKSQCRQINVVETGAMGSWKHFEIDLNPKLTYYGYSIMMDHNDIRDGALYIDDVEVYTASPYVQYEAPAPAAKPIQQQMTYVAKIAGLVRASLKLTGDDTASLSAPGIGYAGSGSYTINGQDIDFSFGDDHYVATISEDQKTLTYKSVSGTGLIAQKLANVNFNMIEYADNAETYTETGTMYYQDNMDNTKISGARGAYHCDYYQSGASKPSLLGDSGWSLMGSGGNQINLDKEDAYEGNQSLQFKVAGNQLRYIQWDLFSGQAKGHKGFNKFGVYFKNTTGADIKVKLYTFTAQKLNVSNFTTVRLSSDELTVANDSSWHLLTLDLDPSKTYYGWGLFTVSKPASAVYLKADMAHFFNDYEGPENNFYAKKGVTLSGDIVPGAASLAFDDNGVVKFTCQAAGQQDVAGTYRLFMNNVQRMSITVAGTTIEGPYTVNAATGQITFKVESKSGTLADYINVDTVFTNAA